jgi:hypothetical protein
VTGCLCLSLLAAVPARADDDAGADLARLIHKAVVAKVPGVYEDKSAWGQTVPLPERVRFPRLKRTTVQVGDHLEVPDGTWRKVRLRLEEPDRNLRLKVSSFKQLSPMAYRVKVEADAALRAEADVQRWRNGLELADLTARADVGLNVCVDCDVTARLASGLVPPRMVLDTDIKELKLKLKDFKPRQVTFRRAGVTVEGEMVEALGEEFKDSLQSALRSLEPEIKKRAGEALVRAQKEGKELLPAADALKAAAPLLRKHD